MRQRTFFAVIVSVLALMPAGAAIERPAEGDIRARGAFTCDFGLPADMPIPEVPVILERDRMPMAARPGFIRKLVPLRIDPGTGALSSGGRYLFETQDDAEAYRRWITTEFALDGVPFFDRPYFLSPDCRSWTVIGAHDFWDIHAAQVLMRTERWLVPAHNQRHLLRDRWQALRAAAQARGFSGVWLLYNNQDDVVSVVYMTNRFVPPNPTMPGFASLAALEYAAPLGQIFDAQPWIRIFDRTQWVLTTWLPFRTGDRGEPSLWPNSPPFPQPYIGDGLCVPSRGESPATAPADCLE